MYRFGIEILNISEGRRSYKAVQQYLDILISDIKSSISEGEILELMVCHDPFPGNVAYCQHELKKAMGDLEEAGVEFKLYHKIDDVWLFVANTDLDELLLQALRLSEQMREYLISTDDSFDVGRLVSFLPNEFFAGDQCEHFKEGHALALAKQLHRLYPARGILQYQSMAEALLKYMPAERIDVAEVLESELALENETEEEKEWSRNRLLLGCSYIAVYFIMAILEVFAIYAWINHFHDVPRLFSGLSSSVLAFIPLVNSVLAYWGAVEVWSWSGWLAISVFFWYYIPVVILFVLVVWKMIRKPEYQ